jgi:CelD/BcsL family acetyltransferase involved in cellulose biosynthesis
MLNILVLDDAREFAALEGDWEDLYHHSPRATPFQSWDWLYSWWEFYGEYYQLRLITIRDEGLLVGLIPLMLKRQGGFGRLLFIGTGLTDYHDILARKGWERKVSEAGGQAIKEIGGWHVLDLQLLPPGAAVWNLYQEWSGPRIRLDQESCVVIEVKPWEELLGSLRSNERKIVRRTLRRAEADGAHYERVDADNVEQAAQKLVALHREAWQDRDIAPEHLTWRFEAFLTAAARRTVASGLGEIAEFRRNGEVIISKYWIYGRDFVGGYMIGASQKALQRYQYSSLDIYNGINIARSRNVPYLDLLRGAEPYKLRWSPRIIPVHQAILGRSLASWQPYAGYRALYSKVRNYANSEVAPWWVKEAKTKYRVVRYTAARYANRWVRKHR